MEYIEKYIDAEKLKTKVKKLNLATKTYEEQVAFNNALAMVVEIIYSLQQEQPFLPANLDEVAERYGTEKHPMTTTGANESAYDFKAGAEWVIRQGVKTKEDN